MGKDGYFIDQYAIRELGIFYAQQNDINAINQTLKLCETEHPNECSLVVVICILHLAINGHTNHIETLLPLLRSMTYVDRSIRNSIAKFVENGQSAVMPSIFRAVGEHIPKYSKMLLIEMVHREVPAKEFEQTWSNLNEIGVTITRHFDVYTPAVRSQSMPMIQAVLEHMHSNSMKMVDDDFKGPIALAAKENVDYFYRTLNQLHRSYGFNPKPIFVRDRILSEFQWKDDPTKALDKLQATGISRRACVVGLVSASLIDKKIDVALKIVSANLFYYLDVNMISDPLLDAYFATADTNNFISFIRCIWKSHEYFQFKMNAPENKLVIRHRQGEFIRKIIDTICSDKRLTWDLKEAFLAAMEKEKFPNSSIRL